MNIQKLMQQAQNMQRKMKEAQDNLKNVEVEGVASGGLVKVLMSGTGIVKKVMIDDSLMKDDKDVLEDLIVIAMNDAKAKVDAESNNAMSDATGGMKLPTGFGM